MKKLKPRTIMIALAAVLLFVFSLVLSPRSSQSEPIHGSSSNDNDNLSDYSDSTNAVDNENSNGIESYANGHILLIKKDQYTATDPYQPTVEECDDPRYTFPHTPPDADTAHLIESYALEFFPYTTTYICSYNTGTIDGEDFDFYEYYDNNDLSLLCIITQDSSGNYSLYDITNNTYTPIIIQ